MKKNTKPEERRVITIGRPSIEHLSKEEQRVFYSSLLDLIIEEHLKEQSKDKEPTDT